MGISDTIKLKMTRNIIMKLNLGPVSGLGVGTSPFLLCVFN